MDRLKVNTKSILLVLIGIALGEGLLWLLGFRPYQRVEYIVESEPAPFLMPHPTLGFCLNPGIFDITIGQHEGISFSALHRADSTRSLGSTINDSSGFDILLFGCSYAYGLGVNDSQTMGWHLQNHFDTIAFKSHCTPGYGDIQAFHLLQNLARKGQMPEIVVLNFCDFHLERNVLANEYRKHLMLGYQRSKEGLDTMMQTGGFPYVVSKGKDLFFEVEPWSSVYSNWPGREHLALVNLLQTVREQLFDQSDHHGASITLFRRINDLCNAHNTNLLVAALTKTSETTAFLKQCRHHGLTVADISVDLLESHYNNQPYDSHPNALAHKQFANALKPVLEALIHKKHYD